MVCFLGASTQVNEARDAFDVFDSADGLLAFENVGKVLDKLGFDEVSDSCYARFFFSCSESLCLRGCMLPFT